MAVHLDVRKWVETLPPWEKDALRRLDERDTLSSEDIGELVLLVKLENGIALPAGSSLKVQPITFPATGVAEDSGSVSLTKLFELKNINALAEDQPVEFRPAGVTVMFGDNGSGKSGFGRLLRTVCWARQRPSEILGNVDAKDVRPQSASVIYRVGEVDDEPYVWAPGSVPPEALGLISVYDADCGSVYLTDEQQAAYVPFGLDYFPRLALVCDEVRARLKIEHEAHASQLTKWLDVSPESPVGKSLAALPLASAKKAVDEIRPLEDSEDQRLKDLTSTLENLKRNDPHKQVLGLRNEARKLREHATRIKTIREALSEDNAVGMKGAIEGVGIKVAAAKLASDKALGKEVLPGTGGAVWDTLWNAARKFSEVAYPLKEFPVCEHGARCVLCQQPLGAEAQERLKAFDQFVRDEAATQAQAAEAAVQTKRTGYERLECVRPDLEPIFEELNLREADLGKRYKVWLESADARRKWLEASNAASNWAAIPDLRPSPEDVLELQAKGAEAQATAIEAAIDDAARKKMEDERAELAGRKWVCEHRPAIAEELTKLELHATLGKLLAGPTSTTKITNVGSALTETHVTEAHKNRFQAELEALRAGHLGVALNVKRGAKGKTMHQLLLTRGEGHSVTSVLSTGERNVIALAAFFSELQPDTGHAVIFDDPVSSLDQDRRDDVARRLARESLKRQVIVWTHDLTFIGALGEAIEKREKTSMRIVTLKNVNGRAGVVDDRLPWPIMKIKERVKQLKQELDELSAAAATLSAKEYEDRGRLFYGHLRDSWERAVEEVLLNGVVERWRKGVQTQRLEAIADKVTRADLELIDVEMRRCSNYAHDQATPTPPPPVPLVSELAKDLEKLSKWVAAKRKS